MMTENSHSYKKNESNFYVSQKSLIGFREFDFVPETVSISMTSNKKKITLLVLVYVMVSICWDMN